MVERDANHHLRFTLERQIAPFLPDESCVFSVAQGQCFCVAEVKEGNHGNFKGTRTSQYTGQPRSLWEEGLLIRR